MAIDIDRVRALTPGCSHVNHLNNAGSSLLSAPVLQAVKDHLDLEARIGGYEAANEAAVRWERAYDAIGTLIGCGRDEVALAENASRAWEMAFHAVPLGPGDRVLADHGAYVSCWLSLLLVQQRTGCTVEVVPNDRSGQLDVEALRRMVDERVKLVAITHVPSTNGLINPAEEVGRVLRGSEALYLLDACQSVGQLPIDVGRFGCDMLSATGRKFLRAPRGTGFLYVRKGVLDRLHPPFAEHRGATWSGREQFTWRNDALRFETWEKSYANAIGLAVAVDEALALGLGPIAERVQALASSLRDQLGSIRGVRVHDTGVVQSGIVTFTVDGIASSTVMERLRAERINVVVAEPANARLDLEDRAIGPVVRASVHYFNTAEELAQCAAVVARTKA